MFGGFFFWELCSGAVPPYSLLVPGNAPVKTESVVVTAYTKSLNAAQADVIGNVAAAFSQPPKEGSTPQSSQFNTGDMLNILGLLGISASLIIAFYYQLFQHELPCPLCLLQRVGMITF
ncbi:disulfide bond formation protein B [Pseudomonas chlororaphis]|uniref:disulfide bond formation protein B n=1 Tax=Pseudomonas chlororaphis TaxID=587753 RepID=UPI0019D1B07E|nr:disulfide bond formation protein B [Pseudomonas chlororaphis]